MNEPEGMREQLREQLVALLQTRAGQERFDELFLRCFPFNVVPPVGISMVETILNFEFGRKAA